MALELVVALALVVANGFFVATEFAVARLGLVTLEDVLEELVGKIEDEFDAERCG